MIIVMFFLHNMCKANYVGYNLYIKRLYNDSLTLIYVSTQVRVEISFNVTVLTIETFYLDD